MNVKYYVKILETKIQEAVNDFENKVEEMDSIKLKQELLLNGFEPLNAEKHISGDYGSGAIDDTVIETMQKKIKSLERSIKAYKDGNMVSMCRISKKDKKPFRIAIRRNYRQFEGDIQGFIKYCVENTTKMSWKDFLKLGE